MEILEKGKIPDDKEVKFTCRVCTSLLKAKRSEGKLKCLERAIEFVCPVCTGRTYVNTMLFK